MQIRFLDNTEEEQIRGITMKSSAISLVYQNERNPNAVATAGAEAEDDAPYLINLVDSPGHVDFSFDVSTAVRLCDGALVLIDAVEGVCAQTHAVIRQAWQEGIRPCLVINKLDRLIFELQYSPQEAYQRLHRILEQANAVLSSLIRADVLERHDRAADAAAAAQSGDASDSAAAREQDDAAIANETEALENELLFSPANGNVLFASAVDGWAFNIGFFAHLYASKLELPFRAVRQALWGDFYYNGKTKKIVTKAPTSNSQTMFCSFILEPIWTTYKTLASPVLSDDDVAELRKLMRQLKIGKLITDRELRAADRRACTQTVMRKWLPLSTAVLKMVTRALPSPIAAQTKRAEKLCAISLADLESSERHAAVFRSLQACHTSAEAPAVVYICKMISVEANVLSDYHRLGLTANEEIYVGVGRVYSGVLRAGQPIYVLDPKFQGYYGADVDAVDHAIKHVTRVPSGVLRPYMMMGRELHALDAVPAGNIVGIVGLHEHVLKTATLSSTLACPSLTKMPYQAKPIVRVAVEPEDPRNFAALEAGLQRLYRSDPTVEVQVQETGEHVVVTLGELHLERCIKDLKERFAKVAVRVSEPLVGFRESITYGSVSSYQETVVFKDLIAATTAASESYNSATGADQSSDARAAIGTTPDSSLTLRVRAVPLPVDAAKLLEESADLLRRLATQRKLEQHARDDDNNGEDATAAVENSSGDNTSGADDEKASSAKEYGEFKLAFERLLRESDDAFWRELPLERVWSCGPRRVGPNVLVNCIPGFQTSTSVFAAEPSPASSSGYEHHEALSKLENSIVTGFQVASAAGPLCDEPVWGVAFVVEDVVFHDTKRDASTSGDGAESSATSDAAAPIDASGDDASNQFGPLSGQVISTMRTICRVAFVKQPVRLVEAIYDCTVQCLAEQLGKLYSVISKRRGDIYSEELSDGTALFTVKAHVPVIESFGFATDLLIQTSGAASNPQLVFSHWSVMALDPFFQPQTDEEREDFGERITEHNYVRKYIEAVRKRKGLARDEKVVVHAEKQRTLSKKR